MHSEPANIADRWDAVKVYFYRKAASGLLPAWLFENRVPPIADRSACTGELKLELVSHCWGYAHMMVYQLSSLILYPPTQCDITMTVFYAKEDSSTAELLAFFQQQTIPRVTWNWQPLNKHELFRRSIGRNKAALASQADWVWFTDCDLLFNQHCLDSLATRLQGSKEVLVFPNEERTTTLLAADDPLLAQAVDAIAVRGINQDQFETHQRTRATGPLQITHGDVARACGYCDAIAVFQKPARHWCKAHEDRVFRWLLGTQGVGVSVPGVYRIRHVEKGRYKSDTLTSTIRRNIRKLQSLIKGE